MEYKYTPFPVQCFSSSASCLSNTPNLAMLAFSSKNHLCGTILTTVETASEAIV